MREPHEKVVIGYLQDGRPFGGFMESMMDLVVYDMAQHQRIVDGGGRLAFRAGHNLSSPRNKVVEKFLDYGKADWLWMVDSDMTFPPDTVERLLEYADPEKAPIVGGLCFAFDEQGFECPTLYDLVEIDGRREVCRYSTWPAKSMFQVAATGAACLLIHRSVFERIREHSQPDGRSGFNDAFPWFQETEIDDRPVSEDFTFCWRALIAGIPTFVNTSVQLGHVKDRILTADSYLAQQAVRGDSQPDFYRTDYRTAETEEASA